MSETTFVPQPGAESVGTLATLAAGYCLMPNDDEALETAKAGIRRAIDRLNTRTWKWMVTYDDIAFVAGTQSYDLDRQFKAPRHFDLMDSSSNRVARLGYLEWKDFLLANPQPGSLGTPCLYSCRNVNAEGLVYLDVTPSASWVGQFPTGRLHFFRRVQYPASANESIDCPSEVAAFILAHAEGFCADRYSPEKATGAYSRAERAYRDIVSDDAHGGKTDWEDYY